MNFSDVEKKILEKLPERVNIYSTVFYSPIEDSSFFRILGSGTFVSSNGKMIILTASHVLDELEKQAAIGISIGNSANYFRMETNLLQFRRLKEESYSEKGPDIGIVKLTNTFAQNILAKNKAFYNLDRHLENDPVDKYPSSVGIWAIVGFPDERKKEFMEDGMGVLNAIGQINLTLHPSIDIKGTTDLMTFQLPGHKDPKGIESYGGISGGGIWHIIVIEQEGKIEIEKVILKGVVFFQKEDRGGLRSIVGHGPNSTYSFINQNTIA